jgi:hypothetical protein
MQHWERCEIWQQLRSQMKLKFLWLEDDLVKHISTKFHDYWSCTLGVMNYSFKCTESARKVTIFGLIKSHPKES